MYFKETNREDENEGREDENEYGSLSFTQISNTSWISQVRAKI